MTFTSGVGTASPITLFDAQTTTLTATQGSITGTSSSLSVAAGSLNSFAVATPVTQTAGTSFNETITAIDTWDNPAVGWTSMTACVTFTGPASSPNSTAPAYPARDSCGTGNSSLSFNSSAQATAVVTLDDAQSTTLTATSVTSPASKTGILGSFTVNAYTAVTTAISSGNNQTAKVSTAFTSPLAALVTDAYGNGVPSVPVTFIGPVGGPVDPVAGTPALANGGTTASTTASANLSTVHSPSDGEVIFLNSQTDTSSTAPTSSSSAITNLTYSHNTNGSMALYSGTPPQAAETLTTGNSSQWGSIGVETTGTSASISASGSATTGTTVTSGSITLSTSSNYLLFASTDSSSGDTLTPSATSFTTAPTFTSIGTQSFNTVNYDSAWYLTGGAGTGTITVTFAKTTSQAYLELVQVPVVAGGTFSTSRCASNPPTNQCVTTTNASGVATSTTYTANASTGGPYNVSASASGTTTANFSLTNASAAAASKVAFISSA